MTAPASPANPPPDRLYVDTLARILWNLIVGVGEATAVRLLIADPRAIPLPLSMRIQARLLRLRRRLVALAEKALAGTLRPPRARKQRTAPAADGVAKQPRAPDGLPRRAGWLYRMGPHDPDSRGGCLMRRGLIELLQTGERDAGFRAFIQSDARFGRLLRPVIHMMMTQPPPAWLRLPPRPRKPRAARPRGERRQRDAATAAAWAPPPASAPPQPVHPVLPAPVDWTPTHETLAPRLPSGRRYLGQRLLDRRFFLREL